MRGYKNFEGTPHPGDLCHLVEIGYTENAINANGYPEPKDVVLCRVWASAVDAGNQHYRAADVMNTEQVINFTIRYRRDVKPGMWVRYAVDFISGRALREMEPAAKMYAKIVALSNAAVKGEEILQEQQISVTDAMDVMIRWFCLLFGNQFTSDDVLDGYPVDRLMHDIALALMAVQTQTTEILSQFPTKAAKEPATTQTEAESEEIPLF